MDWFSGLGLQECIKFVVNQYIMILFKFVVAWHTLFDELSISPKTVGAQVVRVQW